MALDLDSYTDIIVNKMEYTLTGNKNYTSEMAIRAKDNIDCRLNLVDINVHNENAGASITVGQNSTMTLNIIGAATLTGGIYVPAGSTRRHTQDKLHKQPDLRHRLRLYNAVRQYRHLHERRSLYPP